ncbi:hypothetical protein KIN20_037553 [Parelaphostrongylus tenuis]|uniref:aralkylamine N-acetyltransferase n=1 Tax=Parelaphostrongylus tenuis TaxID=148309 RepID=A0AAD5RE47_PARTN|nr:hypothetical protein KIN20_037553 [Parelaphostrongylus tenuis]
MGQRLAPSLAIAFMYKVEAPILVHRPLLYCRHGRRQQVILDFLVEHFRVEEPLNRASAFTEEAFRVNFSHLVDKCLKDPFSIIVRCRDNNKIAGVLLNQIINRTDGKENIVFTDNPDTGLSALGRILTELHNAFFDLVPMNVQRVLKIEISSVAKPFQRQGIASKMMDFSLTREKLQQYRIDGIMAETTSAANQILLAKRGFKNLKEIWLHDVKGSQGQELLRTDDGTEKAILNWKPSEELGL